MNSATLKSKDMGLYDKNLENSLKSGYKEMSSVNLHLAEEAVRSDNDALLLTEQNLRSVNPSDS